MAASLETAQRVTLKVVPLTPEAFKPFGQARAVYNAMPATPAL